MTATRSIPVALALLILGGCASQDPVRESAFGPARVRGEAGPDMRGLVEKLGSDKVIDRIAAEQALMKLCLDPQECERAIEALRAGASGANAGARILAQSILRRTDRRDATVPTAAAPVSVADFRCEPRLFADGWAEVSVRCGERGDVAFFSGPSVADVARRINASGLLKGAEGKPIPVGEDGGVGGARLFQPGSDARCIPSWGIAVEPHDLGPWRIEALSRGGRGARAGFRIGDLIVEVDGTTPRDLADMKTRIAGARRFVIWRRDWQEFAIGEPDAPRNTCLIGVSPDSAADPRILAAVGRAIERLRFRVDDAAIGELRHIAVDSTAWLFVAREAVRLRQSTRPGDRAAGEAALKAFEGAMGVSASEKARLLPSGTMLLQRVPSGDAEFPRKASDKFRIRAAGVAGDLASGDVILSVGGREPGLPEQVAKGLETGASIRFLRRVYREMVFDPQVK